MRARIDGSCGGTSCDLLVFLLKDLVDGVGEGRSDEVAAVVQHDDHSLGAVEHEVGPLRGEQRRLGELLL